MAAGIELDIFIENVGRTPGTVVGGFFSHFIGRAAERPNVQQNRNWYTVGFLHPGRKIRLSAWISGDKQELTNVVLGEGDYHLWIVGEVHYRDRFNGLHTCGYARLMASARRNSTDIAFDHIGTAAHLNFDRPMNEDDRRLYLPPETS